MDEHKQTAILRWIMKSEHDLKTAQTIWRDIPVDEAVKAVENAEKIFHYVKLKLVK